MLELSLVVSTATGSDLRELLRSVDDSTLSWTRFELLLVLGSDEVAEASWRRFADRRPNVSLLGPGDSWRAAARGSYVLELAAGQRLFAEALARMLDLALTSDLDAVAGREVAPGRPVDPRLLADSSDLGDAGVELLGGPVVLHRRERLERAETEPPTGGGVRVGVLGSYPATLRTPADGSAAEVGTGTTTLAVGVTELQWDDGTLAINVSGQVTSSLPDGLVPVLLVRESTSHLTFVVPAGVDGPGAVDPTGAWSTAGVLDLHTGAAGSALPTGEWCVEVALVGPVGSSSPTPLPAAGLPVALVDGRVVVTSAPELVLDVGPTRQHAQQLPVAEDASVVETAAGCRLDVALRGWHVAADHPLPVRVALDRLRVPAEIVPRAGTAVLSLLVSGLPGTYPLGLQLGRAPLQQTGLAVVVAGDGGVTVVPAAKPVPAKKTAPAKKAAAAKKAPGKKPAGKKAAPTPATGSLARLRRAVPPRLEPQVSRLARVPALRAAYRRLTGLSGR